MAKYNPFNPVEPDKNNPFNPISEVTVDTSSAVAEKPTQVYNKPNQELGASNLFPELKPKPRPEPIKPFDYKREVVKNIIPSISENITKAQWYLPKKAVVEPLQEASGYVQKLLNHPVVSPKLVEITKRTSGTGVVSMIQAAGPKTFTEAYEANREAQAGDPSKLNQFMYQLGDTLPQTAIGVGLNFVPFGGPALSTAYWTALSSSEQIQSRGEVTSMTNVGIDVVLDRMLGKSIESIFKTPAKSLLSVLARTFTAEGGTEVSQDLLKMGNDYREANTDAEREAAIVAGKEYFTSGQILMTAGVGGLTGTGIGGGAYALNKNLQKKEAASIPPPPPPGAIPTVTDITPPPPPGAGQTQIVDQEITEPELKTRYKESVNEVETRGGINNITKRIFELDSEISKLSPNSLEHKRLKEEATRLREVMLDFEDVRSGLKKTQIIDQDIASSQEQRQIDQMDRPVGELAKEANKKGPGHRKLEKHLQNLLKDGSYLPEDVVVIRAMIEDTNDALLNRVDYKRIRKDAELGLQGRFKFDIFNRGGKNRRNQDNYSDADILQSGAELQIRTDLAKSRVASWIFAHEFSHLGYWLVLNESERQIVIDEYNRLSHEQRVSLFSHTNNIPHYVESPVEFFAQAGADYIFENKIPSKKMEPLLNKIAKQFFEGIKKLVSRGEVESVKKMTPLFEKILAGDRSTPLSEFAKKEPPSFKEDIKKLMKLAPTASKIAEKAGGVDRNLQSYKVGMYKMSINDMLDELANRRMDEMNGNIPNEGMSDQDKAASASEGQEMEDILKGLGIDPLEGLFENSTPVKPTKEVPIETLAPPFGTAEEEAAKMRKEAIQGLPPDIAETIPPLERVIEGQKRTPIDQRVNILDYLRTPWRVFDKMGLRPAYQKLLTGYEAYMKEIPKNIDKITAWSKRVSGESNERIFEYLDGEDVVLDANETQVANEIKDWLAQFADRLGMSKDARITDYITHIFPKGKEGEIPEEIAYMISKKIPGSVYNPFLLQRLGAPGYKKDTWRALDAYAKRATRKINMDLGLAEVKEASAKLTDVSQLDYINNYLSKVNLRPNKFDSVVDNFIKQHAGFAFGARPTATITRTLRMMVARAKIGGSVTSFAKNLTQGVNTFAELGTHYTAKGYMDLAKLGSKELDEEGVLIAPFIEDRKYDAVKGAIEKVDKVLFANMNASELVNRGAAYYGAKTKFVRGKISPKEFKMAFGKEMPKGYTPTIRDAKDYGKYVAAKTQFKFGALDTPVAMNSDLMKMVFQFQTFGLKQSEFVAQMAKDKEFKKLTRYTISSMLLFELIGSAFGMSWDESWKTFRFGMPPAIKFFRDLFRTLVQGEDQYGNPLDTEEKAKATAGTLFTNVIPAGAQMKRTAQGLGVVSEGAGRTKGGNLQYRVDPTPSNYIRGTLFGKYNLPASQQYYKDKEDKAKGKKSKGGTNPFNPI